MRSLVNGRWIAAVFVLAGCSLVLAGGTEKGKLDGTWKAVEPSKDRGHLTFTGNKFALKKDGKDYAEGTFTVDASKKPHHMDLTVTGGGGEAKEYVGKTSHAIYELDGDTLKWMANEPGREGRPEGFPEPGAPSKSLFLILKREGK